MPLNLKPRETWTRLPRGQVPSSNLPARFVFFGYTRKDYTAPRAKPSPGPNPDSIQTLKELDFIMRGDTWKLPDIRYNFMVSANGDVFEGRGWDLIPNLPSKYYRLNFYSMYITFIGDFTNAPASKTMFEARDELLKYGVEQKYINPKFLLVSLPAPHITNYDLIQHSLCN